MKRIVLSCALALLLSPVLRCSGSDDDSIDPPLPPDVAINKYAGRLDFLLISLRSDTGKDLLFVVDTGSPITLLSKSLEPTLGNRLGTAECWSFTSKQESGIYPAPKLFLAGTQLLTGTNVYTYNFTQLNCRSHHDINGILGMDCLRHYCIQLDFESRKLKFLTPGQVNDAASGQSFDLTFSSQDQSGTNMIRPYIRHVGLLGGTNLNCLIDTGYNTDGRVAAGQINGHFLTRATHFVLPFMELRLPECVWEGHTYTHLIVGKSKEANILGLRFLARHLVTLDFPNRKMYLECRTIGPLTARRN